MGLLMYAVSVYGLDNYAKTSILNIPEKAQVQESLERANLSVEGDCKDGNVSFMVTNTDENEMPAAVPYQIVRNDEIEATGDIHLAAAASQMIVVSGKGDEIRFETPGTSGPNDLVSGCRKED